jgi:hypothetical protein
MVGVIGQTAKLAANYTDANRPLIVGSDPPRPQARAQENAARGPGADVAHHFAIPVLSIHFFL